MSRSWDDTRTTARRYRFDNGTEWTVQNQYRPILCHPDHDCDHDPQWLRLTHIIINSTIAAHINIKSTYEEVRGVLVEYLDAQKTIGIHEIEDGGSWILQADGQTIAKQI